MMAKSKDEKPKKTNFAALLGDDDDYSDVSKSKSAKKEEKKEAEKPEDSSDKTGVDDKKGESTNKGEKKEEEPTSSSKSKTEEKKPVKKNTSKKKAKSEPLGSEEEMKLLFEHGTEMEYGAHLDLDHETLKKLIGTRWPAEIVANDVITMRVGRKNNKWIKLLADEFEIPDTQVLANILGLFRIRYKDFIREVFESRRNIEL